MIPLSGEVKVKFVKPARILTIRGNKSVTVDDPDKEEVTFEFTLPDGGVVEETHKFPRGSLTRDEAEGFALERLRCITKGGERHEWKPGRIDV